MTSLLKYVPVSNPGYRPGTQIQRREIRFVLTHGGLGDFICMLPALQYINKQPHVDGRAACPQFFVPLIKNILPDWKVETLDEFRAHPGGILTKFSKTPDATAVGFHLVDLGFIHFCYMGKPPDGFQYYPELDLRGVINPLAGKRYAVMTPGATAKSRTMPVHVFNAIKDYLVSKGITPVFLGKTKIQGEYGAKLLDYDYEGGINLIDKTEILETAAVLRDAVLVVGLDNGLLHLAACTDVPIVFGYNIASPRLRRPRRRSGVIYDVVPPESLKCRFCQEAIRFIDHRFKECPPMYGDYKCLEEMTAESYIKGIEYITIK